MSTTYPECVKDGDFMRAPCWRHSPTDKAGWVSTVLPDDTDPDDVMWCHLGQRGTGEAPRMGCSEMEDNPKIVDGHYLSIDEYPCLKFSQDRFNKIANKFGGCLTKKENWYLGVNAKATASESSGGHPKLN